MGNNLFDVIPEDKVKIKEIWVLLEIKEINYELGNNLFDVIPEDKVKIKEIWKLLEILEINYELGNNLFDVIPGLTRNLPINGELRTENGEIGNLN